MKLLNKISMSLLGFSLVAAPAFGDINDQHKNEDGAKKQEEQAKAGKSDNLKQVEGTILQHKFVNVFENDKQKKEAEKSGKAEQKMLVVLLKTEKGNDRIVVDLGSMKEAPKIKDGQTKLQVEGKVINVGNKDLFVAKRAKLDGSMFEIKRKSS